MSGIYFEARVDAAKLQTDINNINKMLGQISQQAGKVGKEVDQTFTSSFKNLGTMVAGYFSLNFAGQMIKQIVTVRGEFEQLGVAFETMLGNKAKADKLMSQVVEFAARTPFELREVASGSKGLLAFGVAAEDLMPTLKALGDVSAGLSVPIERLILNFGQVKTQGQLTGRELRDFAVAGVPIIAELSKNLRKSEEEIQSMVSAGKIGFNDVAEAFKTMSSEGGRFADLMDKQSKTVTGQISNLKDAWNQMLNEIGKSNQGAITGAIGITKGLIDNYETVIDILKVLVATYGAYKAAVIAVAVAEKVKEIQTMVGVYNELRKTLTAAAAAQQAFNLSSKGTPWGLVLAGITAIVGAVLLFTKSHDEAAKSMAQFRTELESEKKTLDYLFDSVKKTNEGTESRKKLIGEINNTYGGYLNNLLTEKSTLGDIAAAQDEATKALQHNLIVKQQTAQLKPYTDALEATQGDFFTSLNKVSNKFTSSQKGVVKANIELLVNDLRKQIDETGKYVESNDFYQRLDQIFTDATGKSLPTDKFVALQNALLEYLNAQRNLKIETKAMGQEWEAYGGVMNKAFEITASGPIILEKTNKEKLDKILGEYRTAKKELNRLMAPETRSTDDEKKKQQEIVDGYKKQLEAYGVFVDKEDKANEARTKAQQELSDRLIELENQTQAAKIAAMQEGTDKQKKEIDLQLKQQLDAIDKQNRETLKKVEEQYGRTSPQYKQAETDVKTASSKLEVAATQEVNNKKVAIEQDAAAKIKALRKEVTDSFLMDQAKEVAAVNESWGKKLDEMSKSGKMTGDDWQKLMDAWKNALNDVDTNAALKRIGFEEEVAAKMADIQGIGVANTAKTEAEKLKVYIKYAAERVKLLRSTGKKEDNLQADLIQKDIEGWNKSLVELSKQSISDVVFGFRSVADAVGGVDDELGAVLNQTAQLAENLFTAFSGFAPGGNVISGIAGLIGVVANLKSIFKGESDAEKLEKALQQINKQLGIQSKILADSKGVDYFTYALKQQEDYQKAVDLSRQKLNSLIYITGTGKKNLSGWIEEMIQPVDVTGKPYGNPFDTGKALINISKWTIDQIIDAWMKGYLDLTSGQLDAIGQLSDAQKQLTDFLDETRSKITGTTSESITQSIVDGLANGYDSITDFADTFQEIMQKAIMTTFSEQLLNNDKVKRFYNTLYHFGADEEGTGLGYNQQEIDALQKLWNEIITEQKNAFDVMKQVAGDAIQWSDTVNDENNITGAVKGITEDTAGLIAGQFTAMRQDLMNLKTFTLAIRDALPLMSENLQTLVDRDGLNYTELYNTREAVQGIENNGLLQLAAINESVTHLASIDKKMTDIAKLNSIDSRLEEMNKNLKNL